jgi:CDP-diacylglycerol--glycerol-3-phosphate 3-phosphatidyltransferase
VPVDADALRHWSDLHDGYDVGRSRLVRGWLGLVHRLARPMVARDVPATALTVAGVGSAAATLRSPPPVAAGLVLATALCDGLDGAVALGRRASGRSTARHGTAIDHTADRVTDVLFAAALARAGAPVPLAFAAAVTTLGYETLRAWLRRTGRPGPLVTVGERPIRVAVVCAGLVVAPSLGATTVVVLTSAAAARSGWSASRGPGRGR